MQDITKNLGYSFKDVALLELALTHKSFSVHNNERLEFLGDAVISLYVSERLFTSFSELDEGVLTRLKAGIVSRDNLNQVASELEISNAIRLGKGENLKDNSILGNTFEALIGAILLDSNYEQVKTTLDTLIGKNLIDPEEKINLKDPKSSLQEVVQKRYKTLPSYSTNEVTVNANTKIFESVCKVEEAKLSAKGQGKNRKKAEQQAASALLELIVNEY